MRTKLLSNAGYAAELHKNAQKSHFCKLYKLQFANFSIRPRQVFAFFEQLLSNSRYLQKATFDCFEKLRETFWKISSNLWKALAEVPNYPLFFSGDLPTKRRLPLPRNSLRLVASSTTPQPPSVQHCQPPVSSKVLSVSFFFSFLFFLSLFSVSKFHIARLYFAPANFEPDAM